jgi:hypothetical protein
MKKIICILMALFIMGSASFAQDKKETKAATPKQKSATKTKEAKTDAPKADKPKTEHVKKDGTPDKRFKENKATTDGPKKKDGTPDMRYKKNKDAAKDKKK